MLIFEHLPVANLFRDGVVSEYHFCTLPLACQHRLYVQMGHSPTASLRPVGMSSCSILLLGFTCRHNTILPPCLKPAGVYNQSVLPPLLKLAGMPCPLSLPAALLKLVDACSPHKGCPFIAWPWWPRRLVLLGLMRL